ncbi:MAG: ornithine carbamoyltransferase, partial [Candidatus Dadabacteria bacterium]
MKRDLITIGDLSRDEIEHLFAVAARLKADLAAGRKHDWLPGKTLAMIVEKPSLRTRVTFETGMNQLGGVAIYLGPSDILLGRRESVPD